MKPVVNALSSLSFLLGNLIDRKELRSSDGIVFVKTKFSILKMGFIFFISSAFGLVVTVYCLTNNVRCTVILEIQCVFHNQNSLRARKKTKSII